MLRSILILVFFLLSLLTVFCAPTNLLWYVSILVTEFCWIFFCVNLILLFWNSRPRRYAIIFNITCLVSLVFFSIPVVSAYRLSSTLKRLFADSVNSFSFVKETPSPFSFLQMITGSHRKTVACNTLVYDTASALTLDFYHGTGSRKNPCIIVVHGGSWSAGDSRQLPELNTTLANAGYNVASINYRLAPHFKYPAPVEDVKSVLAYLRLAAGNLMIDTSRFALLGRSAGGQIVLSAAYTLNDRGIKGVISFYGPADMVWGYAHPTNPLVMNSRKVMADYLGGSYSGVPAQYVNSSATQTATRYAVPTLLLTGGTDPLVSPLHAVRLSKKLNSLGVKHYNIYFPWATHGFDWTLNGPAGQLSTWSVMRFLEQVMIKQD